MSYFMIFLGGGLGSLLRFFFSNLNNHSSPTFTYSLGTFFANIISCFVLGSIFSYTQKYGLSDNLKLLFITGFCGGFSTFSTFSLELLHYLQKGNYSIGIIYLLSSVLLGLLGLIVGMKIFS